jgi:hypothetical protein
MMLWPSICFGVGGSKASGDCDAQLHVAAKIAARDIGVTVLAAATTDEQALERYQDHGLFTYIVSDGCGTKAAQIYKKTGNLRAVQLMLGHSKLESTAHYLGIEVDDALSISEQVEA